MPNRVRASPSRPAGPRVRVLVAHGDVRAPERVCRTPARIRFAGGQTASPPRTGSRTRLGPRRTFGRIRVMHTGLRPCRRYVPSRTDICTRSGPGARRHGDLVDTLTNPSNGERARWLTDENTAPFWSLQVAVQARPFCLGNQTQFGRMQMLKIIKLRLQSLAEVTAIGSNAMLKLASKSISQPRAQPYPPNE